MADSMARRPSECADTVSSPRVPVSPATASVAVRPVSLTLLHFGVVLSSVAECGSTKTVGGVWLKRTEHLSLRWRLQKGDPRRRFKSYTGTNSIFIYRMMKNLVLGNPSVQHEERR